jgi:hypothetical protein
MNSPHRHPLALLMAAALLALTSAAHAQTDNPAKTDDQAAAPPVTPVTPATPPTPPIPYAGKIVSATGTLPENLGVFADCEDGRERILGQVDADTYRIDLPPALVCHINLGEAQWASDSQPVFDASVAIPQTMLVYPSQVPEPDIARELVAMGAQDRALRQAWAGGERSAAVQKKMAAEDRVRQRRLRQIVTTKGWPMISMVGAEAANEAWLLAQHCPPAQLKHWAVFMRAAANLAASLDRGRFNETRPQIYGTQYHTRKDSKIQFYRIEDIANIDRRRLEMGMSSFAYLQEQLAKPPAPPAPAPTPPTATSP